MQIECVINREGGSIVEMPVAGAADIRYHFKARGGDGAHVAEVENQAHIQTFLSIPHGYREAPVEPKGGGRGRKPPPSANGEKSPLASLKSPTLEPPEGFPRKLEDMSRDRIRCTR